ncbi:MAG: translation initiation factor IF-3, partial [Patescibacteria group bacterium]
LIEIAPTAQPPVAKIMDYGKFQYQEQKKQKEAGKKMQTTEIKEIRIGLGTSEHDLEMKAKKIMEFLKEKNKVKIGLVLRGREKYLDKNFIEERLKRILNFITEDYKISDAPQKGPRGINIVIEHGKNK